MNQTQIKSKNATVNEILHFGEKILASYNQQDAAIDAKLLLMYVLECDKMYLIMNGNMQVADHVQESYLYLIAKRSQGMPVQYITKEQEFMGLDFYVDERVLIPRQDTETLVETVIGLAKEAPIHKAVEIGVGSGCISISLAKFIPEIQITAIDICERALEVAKKNIRTHELEERITTLRSDVFTAYQGAEGSLDLIVSNPPYISKEECKQLMKEVKEFEPRHALTDGNDGLSFYKSITEDAIKYLKENGLLAYEIGYNQGEAVSQMLKDKGFKEVKVIKDLPGHDRVVIGRK